MSQSQLLARSTADRSLGREVEQNLSAINGLLSDQGGSSNHGLVEELRGTLSLLEADLEDLDETVRVIEETGDRWGIQESEVRSRRNFVQRVESEAGVSASMAHLTEWNLMRQGAGPEAQDSQHGRWGS